MIVVSLVFWSRNFGWLGLVFVLKVGILLLEGIIFSLGFTDIVVRVFRGFGVLRFRVLGRILVFVLSR